MHLFSSKIIKSLTAAFTAAVTLACSTLPLIDLSAAAADVCVVDTTKTYQTITGFGGINHPEWTGDKGGDLTEAQRKTIFGNGDNELGFTVLRVFVNPDKNQWNKAVPTAKYATQMGATVFASPWEPPSNLAESGGSNGKLHLPKSNYAAYAQHLNDFGTYMKNNGVDLYSISVQNEPDYASEWTYWSTDETTDFLANYADKITSTRVMSPESFQYAPENASWVPDGGKKFYTKILNNKKAFENCDLFGTHFYGTQREWMDFPALENCGKPIWMTEVYVPDSKIDANAWPDSIDLAENMHNGLVVGNMSAYVVWYLRRSYGPMTDDGKISKRGYLMAQYSKFIRPGAVRIDATEQPVSGSSVYISSYKKGDQVTIVAVNKSDTEYNQVFSVKGIDGIKSIDRYRTSGSENLAKTANMAFDGTGFNAQIPAKSVSTFVVKTSGGSGDNKDDEIKPNEYGWYFQNGFEEDACGWQPRGGTTLTPSADEHYTEWGSKSLKVTGRESAWNGAIRALETGAFKAGNEYSFSVHVKHNSGEAAVTYMLKLQYKDADGETHYDEIASAAAPNDTWLQLSNENYKIPDGATDAHIYIETDGTTNNFYIDEVIGAVAGTHIQGEGIPEILTVVPGDVNCDGKINIFDLAEAKDGLISGFAKNEFKKAADVNESGDVELNDLVQLQKYIGAVIKTFTVVEKPPVKTMMKMSEYTPIVQKNVVEFETADSKEEKAGVQYGTVKSATYWSTTCNRNKPYNILLPANYDSNKQYPVLYVMHGYWENQNRMIIEGNGTMYTRQIIGNAIASGEAEDMIVVFPYIYSSATQENCSAMDDANNAAYDNFINDLTKDLMPHIESTYSVKTGRENTAITGFSMGGREALLIGMQRSDLFGYVGAICPAPGVTGSFKWNSEAEAPSLLFITAGSNDTVVYSNPENYHNNFTQNGVPHIWHYVNGGYHGDNSIHAHIYNFVRAVFKADK